MSLKSWLPASVRRGDEGRVGYPFLSLQSEINRMFDDMFRGMPATTGFEGLDKMLSPAIDVKETEQGLEVTAELPGVDEKDLDITVADGVLSIKAEKKLEEKKEEKGYHVMERRYGTVARSIRLPFDPDGEKIEAHFAKGVLKVSLPKPPEAAEKVRKIQVKAAG